MGENSRKTLLVYYSRSGKAEIIAKDLQNKIGCDMDKIEYAGKKRVSFIGAIIETFKQSTVKIKGAEHNPGDYEKIIIITPIWASNMTTPIRSYITEHKGNIKSYSLIATCGSGGLETAVKSASDIIQKAPVISEQYTDKQIKAGEYDLSKFNE